MSASGVSGRGPERTLAPPFVGRPANRRPRSRVRRMVLLAGLLGGLAFVRWLIVEERELAPLDHAPRELVVPGYFDEVFFLGQGFPVHTANVVEGLREIDGARMFVLPGWVDAIDYKNCQETAEQVRAVNERYRPVPPWRTDDGRRKGHYRCLPVSASLVLDWFAWSRGRQLMEYESVLDGKRYRGFDPKALDALYFQRNAADPELYRLTGEGHLDPISQIPVPYSAAAFARIIEEESADPSPRRARDPQLPLDYAYGFDDTGPLRAVRLIDAEIHWEVAAGVYPREESERLRAALEHGPLFAGIKARFSALHGIFDDTRAGDVPIPGLTGHGVAIVGWIEYHERLYFLYRETFGRADEERADAGPAWRIYPVWCFNEVFAFERP